MRAAVDYVEENLDGEVAIEDVASLSGCSPFHFHRVFYSFFDVTLAEYVRRRRLTLAAVDVVAGKERIIDIAIKYGYDSPNAFTRAFRKIHGINPSEARRSGLKIATYSRAFPAQSLGIERMDYRIVEKPAFNVVGRSKEFTFDDFVISGPKYWKEYVVSDDYKGLCRLTNGKPEAVTGAPLLTAYFPTKDTHDQFKDVLGVELALDSSSGSFEVHKVPASTYAEFHCSYRGAMKTNRYIYGEWFSATGYERDGDKPDIVAYFPMPYRHYSDMGVRWWIPVTKT